VASSRNFNSVNNFNSLNVNNVNNRSAFYGGGYGGNNRYGGYGGYGGYGRYGYGYNGYPWGIVASSLLGIPYFGYGYGLGYGGYGLGYGGLGYGGLGGWGLGYGGLGYGGYGGGYGNTVSTYYVTQPTTVVAETPLAPTAIDTTPTLVDPAQQPAPAADNNGSDFVAQGEQSFRAGNYDAALRQWRHALVDEPNNAGVLLLMGQALFASGNYDDAAGAVQGAMQSLPQDKWGVVVSNYRDLYTGKEYSDQMRALEASAVKTNSPAERFLLGYQYAYLGYPKEAVRELDRTLKAAPKDQMALQLRDMMAEKAGLPKYTPAETPKPEVN